MMGTRTWATAILFAGLFLGSAAKADAVKISSVYFSTSPDKQSYLRVINLSGQNGSVTVVVRDAGGTVLGTWTKAVTAGTAPQYGMDQIEREAGVTPPAQVSGATNTATLEITSTFEGQLQQVVYNPKGGALTNVSLCFTPSTDVTNVTNVHSSRFASNYPSTITIANAGEAGSATLSVSDSGTGTEIGTYTSPPIAAGGVLNIGISTIESQLGFTPQPTQLHLTLKITGAFSGSLSHTVDNLISGVLTDMTARCRLSPN